MGALQLSVRLGSRRLSRTSPSSPDSVFLDIFGVAKPKQ